MSAGAGPAAEFAPAKVNLALHVTGRRADSYHLLDSLVVFPRVGDRLSARLAPALTLAVRGPFATGLAATAADDNLVLRAARLLDAGDGQGAALVLDKRLPVAGGIGGGSADAAAALRLLARLWRRPLPRPGALADLGADVPVCVAGRAARMRGIGERLDPLALPGFALLLVNPGVPLSTGAVFAGLAGRFGAPLPPVPRFAGAEALAEWLAEQRNDLESPARSLSPPVGEALEALGAQPQVLLARMSGSGATCLGLCRDLPAAEAAAAALRQGRPGWWTAAAAVEPA